MPFAGCQIDLGAGTSYQGGDRLAGEEFQRIADNWGKLKRQLEESGVIPPLIVRITGAYAAGYPWVEVSEESDGTFTSLSGGRSSGVGVYPRAYEQNGGTAHDFANMIVELCLSRDKDSGEVTASFDGRALRIPAEDTPALPSNPTYVNPTLTIPYNIFQFDIKGRKVGSSSASRTVSIPTGGGGVDLKNAGVLEIAAASFINIPTTNLSSDILQFLTNGAGGDLQFKGGATARMVLQEADGGGKKWDWVRGHP